MRFGGFGFNQQFGFGAPAPTVADVAEGEGLGPELVINGGFATDTDWSLADGDAVMSISGGKLRASGTEDVQYAGQTISEAPAGTYRCVFTIDSISSGAVILQLDSGSYFGATRSTSATFSEDIVAAGPFTNIQFSLPSGGDAVIDNLSVKQVL